MPRPFRSSHFTGIDGSILMSNDGSRVATEQDMERHFWRQAEPDLDRLTLEMCAYHRARGEGLELWQLAAEAGALERIGAGAFIDFCEARLAQGQKLDPTYRERYGRALLIQDAAG